MPKYTYNYLYCNREVSKAAFLDKLHRQIPNEKSFNKTFNKMKKDGQTFIYLGEWYQIKRSEITKKKLNKGQLMRLYGVLKLKGKIDKASYCKSGEFEIEGYQTQFKIALTTKDTDWIINGVHLSREAN